MLAGTTTPALGRRKVGEDRRLPGDSVERQLRGEEKGEGPEEELPEKGDERGDPEAMGLKTSMRSPPSLAVGFL